MTTNPTAAFPPELARNVYFQGRFLTAEDFERDQRYFHTRRRHDHTFLHGWGVVHGLDVRLSADDHAVEVTPGAAIDAQGNDLILPELVTSTLSSRASTVFVGIRATNSSLDRVRYDATCQSDAALEVGAIVESVSCYESEILRDDMVVLGCVRRVSHGARSLLPNWKRPLTLAQTWIREHSWQHGGVLSVDSIGADGWQLRIECSSPLDPKTVARHCASVQIERDDGVLVQVCRGVEVVDGATLVLHLDDSRFESDREVTRCSVRLHCSDVRDFDGGSIAGRAIVEGPTPPLPSGAVFESWFLLQQENL